MIETYKKLLTGTKLEFAEKGFQKTSIRSISGRAIGALYQHFDSKKAVFNQVVSQVYNNRLSLLDRKKKEFSACLDGEGLEAASHHIAAITKEFIPYIFGNWELFSILISNQETETYCHFFKTLVDNEVEMSMLLLQRINNAKYKTLTFEQMQVIVSAQYLGIFVFTLIAIKKVFSIVFFASSIISTGVGCR